MPPYDLLSEAFHADPAPVFARMRQDDPVYWCPTLGTWVVTRHADVARLVRDPALSVDRGGTISRPAADASRDELAWCSELVLRWMVFSDPPRHGALRDVVRRAFTAAMVERLRPTVERRVAAAVARAHARGGLEVLGDLANPVTEGVTGDLLGLPDADLPLLKQWTTDTFALLGAGVASAEVVHRAYLGLRASGDYFATMLAAKRRAGGDDLLAELARSPDAAALPEDELVGLCMTLVAGSYETTTHLVCNGVWQLLRHPHVLARLRDEPARCGYAVEELFRFDGPALSVVRRAVTDVDVDGTTIRAGDNVYCMLYAANRDPARFDAPDVLDLDRLDVRHLGLGYGVHFCLGAALSRLEAEVMLRAVVGFDHVALDRDALAGDAPRYVPNLAIRGLEALPLRIG